MRDSLEEEKAVQQRDLHQHYCTGGNDVQEGNDIDHSNAIENNISWTSQTFFKWGHHGRDNEEAIESTSNKKKM